MKVLLDNCVPYRAKRLLKECEVSHVKDVGWTLLSNGELLSAAADAGFAVMITVDKKLKFEQNLDRLPLAVIEIDAADSRLPAITALANQINDAVAKAGQFRFAVIHEDGRIAILSS